MSISPLSNAVFMFWCQLPKRKYCCSNSPAAEQNQKLPSWMRVCKEEQRPRTGSAMQVQQSTEGVQPSSNQYQYLSDVSNYTAAVIVSSPLGLRCLQKRKHTVSLLCVQARHTEQHGLSSLSLHFHSKYTDHCARLRKQGLCILAGGIYSERATDLLYLVFDGWGSEGERGVRVCKIQKREVKKPRAGCQRWYGSPNNCGGFQKWQKQSCLKFVQLLQKFKKFVRRNLPSWTLRRSQLPKLSVICHQGACSSSRRPSRQRDRVEIRADVAPLSARAPTQHGAALLIYGPSVEAAAGCTTREVEARLVSIHSTVSSRFQALREQSRVMLALKISVACWQKAARGFCGLARTALWWKAIDTPNISARPPR